MATVHRDPDTYEAHRLAQPVKADAALRRTAGDTGSVKTGTTQTARSFSADATVAVLDRLVTTLGRRPQQ